MAALVTKEHSIADLSWVMLEYDREENDKHNDRFLWNQPFSINQFGDVACGWTWLQYPTRWAQYRLTYLLHIGVSSA